MWLYYLLALIPVTIGGILFFLSREKEIAMKQWIFGTIGAFILAAAIHGLTIYGMSKDVEIWTGQITAATYYPPWVSTHLDAHHTYDEDGNITSTYYTRDYDNEDNYSQMIVGFGFCDSEAMRVDNSYFEQLAIKFGNRSFTTHNKSGYYSGDKNVYHTFTPKGVCIPITIEKSFKNRVKASPSSFSFKSISKDIPVFEYPYSKNIYQSNRLVGDAARRMDIKLFDQLNARVGQFKKGNVIIVGFNNADSKMGEYQRDKFLGGKKNDIIICYGMGTLEAGITNIVWTKAFSWCKNEVLLTNLEKMFKEEPIDNTILPKVEKEIFANFEKRNWSELDYIKITPSSGWWWVYGITMFLIQVILWFGTAAMNDDSY